MWVIAKPSRETQIQMAACVRQHFDYIFHTLLTWSVWTGTKTWVAQSASY